MGSWPGIGGFGSPPDDISGFVNSVTASRQLSGAGVRSMDRSAYQCAASAVHHDERSGASGSARRLKLGFQVPTDLCVARQTLFQGGEGFSRFLSQSVAV